MTANRERIKGTLDLIESMADGEKLVFHMGHWSMPVYKHGAEKSEASRCGTAMCFAGWSVYHQDMVVPEAFDYDKPSISVRAMDYLGLTMQQADEIFSATHIATVDELREHINKVLFYTEGEGL